MSWEWDSLFCFCFSLSSNVYFHWLLKFKSRFSLNITSNQHRWKSSARQVNDFYGLLFCNVINQCTMHSVICQELIWKWFVQTKTCQKYANVTYFESLKKKSMENFYRATTAYLHVFPRLGTWSLLASYVAGNTCRYIVHFSFLCCS